MVRAARQALRPRREIAVWGEHVCMGYGESRAVGLMDTPLGIERKKGAVIFQSVDLRGMLRGG